MKLNKLALYRLWRCFAGVLILSGCGGSDYLRPAQLPAPMIEREVRLAPGDIVEVKFLYWPELNENQRIRSDGKISLQYLGAVPVVGFTPEQLAADLEQRYRAEIKDPQIEVIVREQADRKIYVGGQVHNTGIFDLTHRMTLVQALVAAGGILDEHANSGQVLVIRHRDGKRFTSAVDVRERLRQSSPEAVYLAAGDIIYVPRTRISRVNQWVDQYIAKLLPSTGFQINVQRGNANVGLSSN